METSKNAIRQFPGNLTMVARSHSVGIACLALPWLILKKQYRHET